MMRKQNDPVPLVEHAATEGDVMKDDENIENEGRELARRLARQWVHEGTKLIPLALIAIEVDESIDQVADLLGDDVVLDDIGMRAVKERKKTR